MSEGHGHGTVAAWAGTLWTSGDRVAAGTAWPAPRWRTRQAGRERRQRGCWEHRDHKQNRAGRAVQVSRTDTGLLRLGVRAEIKRFGFRNVRGIWLTFCEAAVCNLDNVIHH